MDASVFLLAKEKSTFFLVTYSFKMSSIKRKACFL